MPLSLPSTGLWVTGLDLHSPSETADLIMELEELGLGALWLSEGLTRDPFVEASRLLSATRSLIIGTGIAVIWGRHPHWMRASAQALLDTYPDRFAFGIGTSNARVVTDVLGLDFQQPLNALRTYLDDIDTPDGLREMLGLVRTERLPRLLAALGPRALDLARDRAEGAITYLVPPEHTAQAHTRLGPDRMLVVEQAVIIDADHEDARARARAHVASYLAGPAYLASLRRLGYTDADLDNGGSDKLINALVAIGEDQVNERINAHLAAGADHVCLQALTAEPFAIPAHQWRLLAQLT